MRTMGKKTDKRIKLISIYFLMLCFFNSSCLFPVYANSIIPDNSTAGHNVIIDKAANGVPVVNINDPNSAGVSHNQFIDFNVEQRGVILNNSQADAISTLGGAVFANPNLNNNANTIINEVTSTRPSNINGAIEILGQSADYILANPNGINVNGIEFINAHKVTLTTGAVGLDSNGNLDNLMVEKGTIEFNGRDLNLKNLDYFDVISKIAKINAKIHASNDIKIITGNNKYNIKERNANALDSGAAGKSFIAIDSSIVGGLYAGRITIISNENGVGVNLPDIKANTDNIEITANGNITHNNLSTPKKLKIESKQGNITILNQKKVSGRESLEYRANAEIIIGKGAKIVSLGSIDINSNSLVNNRGIIVSESINGIKIYAIGLNNEGIIHARSGNVNIESSNDVINQQKILGLRKISIKSNRDLANHGVIIGNDGINFVLDGKFSNLVNSSLESKSFLNIATGSFENSGSIISPNEMVIIANATVVNDGTIKTESGKIIIDAALGAVTNRGNIRSDSADGIKLGSVGLANEGMIHSQSGSVSIDAQGESVTNKGGIIGKTGINFVLGNQFMNSKTGYLTSNGNLSIDADNAWNKGLIFVSDEITMNLVTSLVNENDIKSENQQFKIDVTEGYVNNSGNIIGELASEIKSKTGVTNQGVIFADGLDIESNHGSIDNSGRISSTGEMKLKALNGSLSNKNTGVIVTDSNLGMDFGTEFENNGQIIAFEGARLNLDGDVVNNGKLLVVGLDIVSLNGSLRNIGLVDSGAHLNIKIAKDIDNLNGIFKSLKTLDITSDLGNLNNIGGIIDSEEIALFKIGGNIVNKGDIVADEMEFQLKGKLDNDGLIETEKLLIYGNGDFQNTKNIVAYEAISFDMDGNLNNTGEIASTKIKILQPVKNFDNSGKITGHDKIDLVVSGDIVNSGQIVAENQLIFDSKRFTNADTGNISTKGPFLATISDNFTNSGVIKTNNGLTLNVDGVFTNNVRGRILSTKNIDLTLKNDANNFGHIEATENLTLKSNKLENDGNLIGGKKTNISTVLVLTNKAKGHIEASGDSLVFNAGGKFENQGAILGNSTVNITSQSDIQNSGNIQSNKALDITSDNGGIINTGKIQAFDSARINAKTGVTNDYGNIESSFDMDIIAEGVGYIKNTGAIIGWQNLDLKVGSSLENSGTIKSTRVLKIDSENKIFNNGIIDSKSILTIKAKNSDVQNTDGLIRADGDVTIIAEKGRIINSLSNKIFVDKFISSEKGNLTIISHLGIDNDKAHLESGQDLVLASATGNFTNDGNVISHRKATLEFKEALINSGYIQITDDLILTKAKSLDNSGGMSAGGVAIINLENDIINSGLIQSIRQLTLKTTKGSIINNKVILGLENAIIEAKGDIVNQNGATINANQMDVTSTGGSIQNTNNSTIASAQNELRLKAHGNIDNKNSIISAKQNLNITSTGGGISNTENSTVKTEGELILRAKAGIVNQESKIESSKKMAINSLNAGVTNEGRVGKAATIISSEVLDIKATQDILNEGGRIEAFADLTTSSKVLTNNGGEILSGTVTQVVTDKLVNSGQIQGQHLLKVDVTGVIDNNQGGVLISGRDLNINAGGDITNRGTIQAENGAGVISSTNGKIDNYGNLSFKGSSLTLSANNDITNAVGGSVAANSLDLNSGANIVNNDQLNVDGKINVIRSANFLNNGLTSFNELVIARNNDFNNQINGGLKGVHLTVDSNNFNNLGNIELTGRINITAYNFISNKLLSQNGGNITINSDFTNSNNLDFGGGDITIHANSITNQGIFKSGNFTGNSASSFTNNGTIFARNDTTLRASNGITNSGYIVSGGNTRLETNSNITNSGRIFGRSSVRLDGAVYNLSANIVNNSNEIKSNGSVTIVASGIVNNNLIAGKNELTLRGVLTNSAASVLISNGTLTINTNWGSLTNEGTITSNGNAIITTNSFINNNLLQAAGTLTVDSTGSITNNSSIYGGVVNLTAEGITNNQRIIAVNSMSLNAGNSYVMNASGQRNAGEISLVGDGLLSIRGGAIINTGEYKVNGVNNLLNVVMNYKRGGLFHMLSPGQNWEQFDGSFDGNYRPDEIHKGQFHGDHKTDFFIYKDKVTKNDIVPIIASNGTMEINANGGRINNLAGKIFSNSTLQINGGSLNNTVDLWKYIVNATSKREPYGIRGFPLTCSSERQNVSISLIQSGGAIIGNLSGDVTNGSHESGPYKRVARNNANVPAPIQGDFDVQQEPANLVVNIPVARMIPSIAKTPQGQNNIAAEKLPAFAPNIQGVRHPDSIDLALENIDSKGGKISMDIDELGQMARNLARSYEPEVRPNIAKAGLIRNVQPIVPNVHNVREFGRQANHNDARAEAYDIGVLDVQVMDDILPNNNSSSVEVYDIRTHDAPVIEHHDDLPQTVAWDFADDPEIMAILSGNDWDAPNAPEHYYIRETSPIFTDLKKYFSTDNFISRIPNYNPEKEVIHYGDPMKQMDLIRRQMVQLTGLMSLEEGVDYVTQVHNLYEAGIRAQSDLQLAPGITLTKELARRLQENIIWPELLHLDGLQVMVPYLYLAKSNTSTPFGGIAARHVDITASNIHNSGNIVGGTIDLKAHGDLTNLGGKIVSGRHMNLVASGDISNIGGGQIDSRGSAYLQANNIRNETATHKYGFSGNERVEAGPQSSIKVAGMLALSTRGNLTNTGASMKAGSLALDVGGSFINQSVQLGSSMESLGDDSYYRERSVVFKPGTIEVETDLTGMVAGNFGLIGSKIKVGGNSALLVAGNTLVQSQIDSHSVESYGLSESSGFFGTTETINSSSSHHETLVNAGMFVGKKSILFNQGEQTFVGARMSSGEGTALKSSGTRFLGVMTEDHDASSSSSKNAVWQSSKQTVHSDSTFHGSDFAGGVSVDAPNVELEFNQPEGIPSWARSLDTKGASVTMSGVQESHESWDKSQSGLTPEAAAVVSVAAGAATIWAGGFGAAATTSHLSLGTVGTTMLEAGATTLASRGAVSMVNNGLDAFKTAKDLTSEESLRDLGSSMLIAGATFGIADTTGFGKVASSMKGMERFGHMAERGALNAGVRSVFSGEQLTVESLRRNLASEAGSSLLAMGQSVIGDIGIQNGLAEGGFAKSLMHGAIGGAYSQASGGKFASGAIGGSVAEFISSKIGDVPASGEMVKATASAAMFAIGADARAIQTAGSVASSAVQNNRELHKSEGLALQQEQELANTQEERQDLEDAAAFLVKVSAGVNEDDNPKTYPVLSEQEQRGSTKIEAQKKLIARSYHNKQEMLDFDMFSPNLVNSGSAIPSESMRTFDYTATDREIDTISRQDRYTRRAGQVTQIASGAVGTGASAAMVIAGSVATLSPAGIGMGSLTGALSIDYMQDGIDKLFSPYPSDQVGSEVLASLKGQAQDQNPAERMVVSAVETGLDLLAIGSVKHVVSSAKQAFRPLPTTANSALLSVKPHVSRDAKELLADAKLEARSIELTNQHKMHRHEVTRLLEEIEIVKLSKIENKTVKLGALRKDLNHHRQAVYASGNELSKINKWDPRRILTMWDDSISMEVNAARTSQSEFLPKDVPVVMNNVPENHMQKELLKNYYASIMEKPVVQDGNLYEIIKDLNRVNENPLGNGSTQAALRNEIKTAQPTKEVFHFQKMVENRKKLEEWLRDNKQYAAMSDIQAAENTLRDVQNVLREPIIRDDKLVEIVKDIYKYELRTGDPTKVKLDLGRTEEYTRKLEHWLGNNPHAEVSDVQAVEEMLIDMQNIIKEFK